MIVAEKEILRTEVENLFLREMVIEDNNFLIRGEGSEIDDMIESSNIGLFDDNATIIKEEFDEDIAIEDILDDEDDDYLFDDLF